MSCLNFCENKEKKTERVASTLHTLSALNRPCKAEEDFELEDDKGPHSMIKNMNKKVPFPHLFSSFQDVNGEA